MESEVNDVRKKYLELEMNVEKKLLDISDVFHDSITNIESKHDKAEEFIDVLTYFMKCIEENQKFFTQHAPPNKCFGGDPLKIVANMKDYISFFIAAIRQEILWKYTNIQYGECILNPLYCVWKTICFALFDNPRFIEQLYDKDSYYPECLSLFLEKVTHNPTIMKTAVIVLADGDIDSVVSFLTSIKNEPCVWEVSKVYVHELIEEKFTQLYKERRSKDSVDVELILTVFRFKEELPSKIENHTDAISIWTENVSTAKCFVMNMMVPLVWINSYGEFGPGISLPTNLNSWPKPPPDEFDLISETYRGSGKKIDLFYDGLWKEPKSGKYSIYFDISRASASREDIEECVQSAKKGFDKWRCVPLSQRKKVLQSFTDRIAATGNTIGADLMKFHLENPTLFGSTSTIIRDGTVEVLTVRDPKGIIVIRGKDINRIFLQLINACVAGNSVIVVTYSDYCSIAEYCDMLMVSGIPPGVINILSFEICIDGWEEVYGHPYVYRGYCPCFMKRRGETGECYFESDWPNPMNEDAHFIEKMYMKYTQPKSIWLPL